jgi:hypothetical protein
MESAVDESSPASPGEALVQELLWVHGIIRRDLALVRKLAANVAAGALAEQIKDEVAALESHSPLWKMRMNCLYYCRLVRHHHSLEDAMLFPAPRRSDPALEPVVDRLEADHRRVADYCDEVVAAADGLAISDGDDGRQRVVAALNGLAEHLLAHLDFEEGAISPTLRGWDRWPTG